MAAVVKPHCPWQFLAPLSSPFPPHSSPVQPPQQCSFAQALMNSCDIPMSQLPKTCKKGYCISITISEDEYLKRIESYKNSLHGCLLLTKGNQPIKLVDLRAKLAKLWKPIGQWSMTPLGKGFMSLIFPLLRISEVFGL